MLSLSDTLYIAYFPLKITSYDNPTFLAAYLGFKKIHGKGTVVFVYATTTIRSFVQQILQVQQCLILGLYILEWLV